VKAFIRNQAVTIGYEAIKKLESIITWGSLIGNPTFFPSDVFPWARRLEDNWKSIRIELEEVLKDRDAIPNFQDISKDQLRISNDDRWKTYFFYAFGFKAERNCQACPETARLIESVPGMQTAFFSILAPGKHIPPHRGAFKGVVRYHLGLICPEPVQSCRIRVGEDYRYWEEGKSLVFDDTFQHEVWNDTDGTRVVLFMDIVRPLKFPANVLNSAVIALIKHSPFVKDGIANYEAWEARLPRD
jgi:aspartyl/asparaginyl beta-hydroxylase (cupin superfamily)